MTLLDRTSQQRHPRSKFVGEVPVGEGNDEGAALAQFALHADTAPQGVDRVLDDGQPQTGSPQISRPGFIHAVEAFEDAFPMFIEIPIPLSETWIQTP